jgi:hypothetical protein
MAGKTNKGAHRSAPHAGKLTALKVAGAKEAGLYGDGLGLYLKVDPGGSKSWVFRYKIRGRSRKLGVGPVHSVGLALARQKAGDARRLLLDGIDPIEQRRTTRGAALLQAAKSITFDDCSKRYIAANKVAWKNPKHISEWSKTLQRYASPVFGHLAVGAGAWPHRDRAGLCQGALLSRRREPGAHEGQPRSHPAAAQQAEGRGASSGDAAW